MSKITAEEVQRIAQLAHLGLSQNDVTLMTSELSQIVGFVEQLKDVDVSEIEGTDQVNGLTDVWREDIVSASLPRDELLRNAPTQQNGYIVVKRVLND